MKNKKVVVGMSGGVDSSVAAYLLKEEGYDVIGVTMQIWQDEPKEKIEDNGGCCGLSAVDDARNVAFKLDIPYYVMNFKNDFKKYVIDYFVDEYKLGRTPNPCIACNRYVKWEALLTRSMMIGADYIATGHYARIDKHPQTGRYCIKNSVTAVKDQTYALYNLTQEQLSKTLMPIGQYTKDEIRKIAEEIGLVVANKPDSQDICFIPDGDYVGYLENEAGYKSKPGNYVDLNGNVIGKHKGIVNYTIGQRKGLGVSFGKHMYVTKINAEDNTVVLGDNSDLFKTKLICKDVNFMAFDKFEGKKRVKGKIRYSHKASDCVIEVVDDNTIECTFDEPQRAVTPGQAAVFYDGEYVACGGIIVE